MATFGFTCKSNVFRVGTAVVRLRFNYQVQWLFVGIPGLVEWMMRDELASKLGNS